MMGVEHDESGVVGSQGTHTGHVQDLGPDTDSIRRQSSHLNPRQELIGFVISKMAPLIDENGSERKERDKLSLNAVCHAAMVPKG